MASERQIAANRRNAAKSTGARSAVGKNRARLNALRHGLTQSLFAKADTARAIEDLAVKIAGGREDFFMLVQARVVAEYEVELARIRFVKIALLERILSLGTISLPLRTKFRAKWTHDSVGQSRPKNWGSSQSNAMLTALAVQRTLPDLRKIQRYEQRAAARRDRALRELIRRRRWRNAEIRSFDKKV